jgi:small subunit ribosomal protein S16
MIKIRLKRMGRKKRPFYRVVVMNQLSRRDGAPLEELGFYNPMTRELKLDKQAALSWVAKGAAASETAQKLIDSASETGELVVLPRVEKVKISKKQKTLLEEQAKAKAEAEAAKAEAAATPAEPVAEEVSEQV